MILQIGREGRMNLILTAKQAEALQRLCQSVDQAEVIRFLNNDEIEIARKINDALLAAMESGRQSWRLYYRRPFNDAFWTQDDFSENTLYDELPITYEDQLPEMTEEDYAAWFKTSKVIDGVRMGIDVVKVEAENARISAPSAEVK